MQLTVPGLSIANTFCGDAHSTIAHPVRMHKRTRPPSTPDGLDQDFIVQSTTTEVAKPAPAYSSSPAAPAFFGSALRK